MKGIIIPILYDYLDGRDPATIWPATVSGIHYRLQQAI